MEHGLRFSMFTQKHFNFYRKYQYFLKSNWRSILRICLILFCTLTFPLKAVGSTIEEVMALEPYLLQADHPIKPMLDALFGKSRVTFNLKSLINAGFLKATPRKFTNLIVTKHPNIPGFIFKIYLDTQRYFKRKPEYDFWILRILGAEKIRETLKYYELESIFKVPQKWIYVLPEHTFPSGYSSKYSILVEEDMSILPREENKKAWASDRVTQELLNQLWFILTELGLSDCAKPDNIPFSTDGRIAFVDTEIFGRKKIRSKKLTPHLSIFNQKIWKNITR